MTTSYGEDSGASSAVSGLGDTTKLGILAGALGLTGLIAYAYRDGGWLQKKFAKGGGPGYGPTFPVGSAAWAEYQANQNPSAYGQAHRSQGGGPGYGPTMPIGGVAWVDYEDNQNPSAYAHPSHGAPGGGVRHAGHGALESDRRAQGAPSRLFIAGGGESPNVIAAKYGRVGDVASLIASNPGVDWSNIVQGTQITIPNTWPPMGG